MGENELRGDELEAQDGELLPQREAMSLIPPPGDFGGLEGLAASGSPSAGDTGIPPADGGGAPAASDAADLASTEADASGSGSESVTDADRSDTFVNSDSASAES